MLALIPFLDDQGENDLLAIVEHYIDTNFYRPDILKKDRINRLAEWRAKITMRRTP